MHRRYKLNQRGTSYRLTNGGEIMEKDGSFSSNKEALSYLFVGACIGGLIVLIFVSILTSFI